MFGKPCPGFSLCQNDKGFFPVILSWHPVILLGIFRYTNFAIMTQISAFLISTIMLISAPLVLKSKQKYWLHKTLKRVFVVIAYICINGSYFMLSIFPSTKWA